MIPRNLALTLLALALSAASAFADPDEQIVSRNPDFAKGVKAVKAKDFRGAIDLFTKVVSADPKDASAFNYLGYSHRQLGELDAALKEYNTALTLNPDHRGAHEYLGELYLKLNDLPKAKEHLAQLDKICWLGCGEYTDLKHAIRAYEAQHKQ